QVSSPESRFTTDHVHGDRFSTSYRMQKNLSSVSRDRYYIRKPLTISRADTVLHNVGACLKKRTFQSNTYQYGAIRGFFPELYSTEMITVRTNKRWGLDSFRYNDPSLYYASKSND